MQNAIVPNLDQTFAARRDRLAAHLDRQEFDAALVTRLVNVRYLTGLTSSNAALLVRRDGVTVLATDGRYATQARDTVPDVELIVERAVAATLARRAAELSVHRLAIEEHDVTLEQHDTLRAASPDVHLLHLGRAVEELRRLKDDVEIDAVARACAISSQALEDLLAGQFLGRTEKEVARDLENRMYDLGADGIAFETIVAAGPNSAIPHHRAGGRVIKRGDLLKIDFGALVDGYHADCTRTVIVVAEPAGWQQEIHDLVRKAQSVGRDSVAPDIECLAIDRAARDVIVAAGYGDNFTHGLGHGVGLEIHEAPMLGNQAPGKLADRMLVTVEPGIYLPGRGGVRIEDTLVVRNGAAGGSQPLTTTARELLVVGA